MLQAEIPRNGAGAAPVGKPLTAEAAPARYVTFALTNATENIYTYGGSYLMATLYGQCSVEKLQRFRTVRVGNANDLL